MKNKIVEYGMHVRHSWRRLPISDKIKESVGKVELKMNLEEKCKVLLTVCQECLERHAEMRAQDREPDFFKEVKPYADKYHTLLDEWAEESYAWIKIAKPKYVHPSQVDTLTEGMKQFIVQSFYKKTGLKRFVLSIRSAEYTLKTYLDALEEAGERE